MKLLFLLFLLMESPFFYAGYSGYQKGDPMGLFLCVAILAGTIALFSLDRLFKRPS